MPRIAPEPETYSPRGKTPPPCKLDSSAKKATISAFFDCDHIESAGARASIQRLAHVIKFGSMAELRQAGAAGAVKRGTSETWYVHATDEESSLAHTARHFRRLLRSPEHEGDGSGLHNMAMTPRPSGDTPSDQRSLLDAIERGDGARIAAAAAVVADRERALGLWGPARQRNPRLRALVWAADTLADRCKRDEFRTSPEVETEDSDEHCAWRAPKKKLSQGDQHRDRDRDRDELQSARDRYLNGIAQLP